jgi:hypothetical protein
MQRKKTLRLMGRVIARYPSGSLISNASTPSDQRLACEAAKLDRAEEQALANEIYAGEVEAPEY